MSDLLTRDEYQAIADALQFPQGAFIDGRFQPGKGGTRKYQSGDKAMYYHRAYL